MNPRQNVQKAAVRVIASELDRRSGSLEQALRDVREQMNEVAAASATRDASLAQMRSMLNNLSASHERITARLDQLGGQMTAREQADFSLDDAVRSLRFDLDATSTTVADLQTMIAQSVASQVIDQGERP